MGTGVGVAHNHRVSRSYKTFFRKEDMTHTIAADIKKILYVVSPGPVSEDLSL
jgi:hypothetical protein